MRDRTVWEGRSDCFSPEVWLETQALESQLCGCAHEDAPASGHRVDPSHHPEKKTKEKCQLG